MPDELRILCTAFELDPKTATAEALRRKMDHASGWGGSREDLRADTLEILTRHQHPGAAVFMIPYLEET